MSNGLRAPLDARSTYFYLSYAHVPPPPRQAGIETNHWVKEFYSDLHTAVQSRASSPAQVGFYDALLPPGGDWNELVRSRLESVEVFVPLYSPRYFSRARSLSEWDMFAGRLHSAGAPPESHVCPVLWVPMPSLDDIPLAQRALALGDDIDSYAADGLQTMLRLRFHHDSYHRIVARLAEQIVKIAETQTLGPSAVPPQPLRSPRRYTGTPFVVAALAPCEGELPESRRGEPYGATALQWRPYDTTEAVPVVETATNIVEILNLEAEPGQFEVALFARNPGLMLIDPWWLAVPDREPEFAAMISALPPWVGLMMAVDAEDPQLEPVGADLVQRVNDLVELAGREVRISYDLDAFARLARTLIVRAQQAFYRGPYVYPPDGPHEPIPRLQTRDDEPPTTSDGDSDL